MRGGWANAAVRLGAIGLLAVPASAQMRGGWALEIGYMPGSGGVVSPTFPEARVTLLAWFENAYAFAGGDGDVAATDGRWADARLLPVGIPSAPQPPGTSPGVIDGSRVRNFIVGQVMFIPHPPPSLSSIPLWEGTWTAGEFTPRGVLIATENTLRFHLYDQMAQSHPILPPAFSHGEAVIRVVPAPGVPALLACAAGIGLRRRRTAPRETRP